MRHKSTAMILAILISLIFSACVNDTEANTRLLRSVIIYLTEQTRRIINPLNLQ